MIRQPAVAGRFYPSNPRELTREVDAFITQAPVPRRVHARGCIVPHAGYMYSGHVAGAVYAQLELPTRFVMLCPRHYPQGQPLAILSEGVWHTPLGDVPVDGELAAELIRACPLLREDAVAHRAEHALEVQLPFLQRLVRDFRFVPIALGTDRFQSLEQLGQALAQVLSARSEPVLIVASSDMNHYESDDVTRRKDHRAIAKILALDPRGLYDTVRNENISMCGFGPAVAMLTAARRVGATRAELVKYATSGDISGDRDAVVGYAGIIVH
jgi:AmmeMemoRadiSam system protein B